jgi:PiT family inorganic phosphate transporter
LFVSPLIGFVAGFIIANIIYLLSWNASPRVNGVFKKLQVITSLGLALSHGTNDSQKTMGVITMGLVISGMQSTFQVPLWVVFVCALTIAIGTSVGGWQLIKTLGSKFYKVRPVHGFAAQATSAAVILTAYLSSANAIMAQGFELRVIAAAVVGGTSLKGGQGTLFGTFTGALFFPVINIESNKKSL